MHDISWWDLEFDRVAVPFLSTAGVPQTKWVKVGMPRIPQNVINGVFYLYRDRADADAGRNPGGTGFVVRYDGTFTEMVPGHHFYGVTNSHVACGAFSTIRLNKKDGGTDIIELGPDQWHFIPGKYDVAVVPLTIDDEIHQVSSISTHQFAERPERQSELLGNDIGVGEDVFMIGLFIDHNGITTNVPSARFGNISMLPNSKAKIEQSNGYKDASYVVDMHSRTGFSGSPVYVYRTFGSDLTRAAGHDFEKLEIENLEITGTYGNRMVARGGRLRARSLFKLLGILWAQFPEKMEVRDDPGMNQARRDLLVKGRYIEGMSGMSCVIPSWEIMEVLDMPDLKGLRHPGIVAAKKAAVAKPKPQVADDAPLPNDANPNHREDFNSLVGAAAQKREQED
jgi:hypothetical protein